MEATSPAAVVLKPGRDRSLRNRHPWVFSGGIFRVDGAPRPGDAVAVRTSDGRFLGTGLFNPDSQIRVRMLRWDEGPIDTDFWRERLRAALAWRERIIGNDSDACRLVNAEGDLLPGWIVDRYGDLLVTQFNSRGLWRRRKELVELLAEMTGAPAILERSDEGALRAEGVAVEGGRFHGEERDRVEIRENGLRFVVDVLEGQKTGFFLDQRDNRRLIGELAAGRSLLNCFAYSGGFSVYGAVAGATTTSVEVSEPALELARENFALNGLDGEAHRFEAANVFEYLRQIEDEYEVIVLDPPAFAKHRKSVDNAARGYKDINRLALQKIAAGGILMTCSCSAFVSEDLFRKILFSAAQEAGREVQIIARPAAPADHPVSIYHPEGEYLKTLVLRVVE